MFHPAFDGRFQLANRRSRLSEVRHAEDGDPPLSASSCRTGTPRHVDLPSTSWPKRNLREALCFLRTLLSRRHRPGPEKSPSTPLAFVRIVYTETRLQTRSRLKSPDL